MPSEIRLDSQAAALLKQVQRQLGPVRGKLEAQIADACPASQVERLGAEALAQILIQAMPEQAAFVTQAKQKALCYHPDGKNAKFLTQLLDLRVEKEFANVYVPQPPPPRTSRDPYYTSFSMDPKADFVLLFNARDVDRNGEPLLMKVVARDRADVEKLDLSGYRVPAGKKMDVDRVANDADFVEVKDTDEVEFDFGDPLKQISLGAAGQELSTSVATGPTNVRLDRWYLGKPGPNGVEADLTKPYNINNHPQTGPQLDRRGVVTFEDRARVATEISDAFATKGGWLNSKLDESCKVELRVERGYAFEPGAEVTFRLVDGGTSVVKADAKDAQLLGTPSAVLAFSQKISLGQALNGSVGMTNKSVTTFAEQKNLGTGLALIGAYPDDLVARVAIAGKPFVKLGALDVPGDFASAGITVDKKPLPDDPEQDGQRVRIALDPSFAKTTEGKGIEGWKVLAGYTDEAGAWHGSELKTLSKDGANGQKLQLEVDVADAPALLKRNGKIELRIFNADNVPAQSVHIPLRAVKWAADL